MVLGKRLKKIFDLAGVHPGMCVLDVGCGRGELVLHSAEKGAEAVGIDSSEEALEIARGVLDSWVKVKPEIKNSVRFELADCDGMSFGREVFDVVFVSDIIEHLCEKDLSKTVENIFFVLKTGGKLVLHSSPNRIFVKYGLMAYRIIGKLYGKDVTHISKNNLPAGCGAKFHVNEQTIFSLKKLFRKAGFKKISLWLGKNPHYIYYFLKDDIFVKRMHFLSKLIPVKHLFYADIYGVVTK